MEYDNMIQLIFFNNTDGVVHRHLGSNYHATPLPLFSD